MKKWAILILLVVTLPLLIWNCGDDDETKITKIYMFSSGTTTYDGNLGGRTGADNLLTNHLPAQLKGKTIHAFLSVDATDCLTNMPTKFGFPNNVPIVNADGSTVIADSWTDLMSGFLKSSLQAAGVTQTSYFYFWTGSLSNGAASAETFNGWTINTGLGTCGAGLATNVNIISNSRRSGSQVLVGICY